MFKSPALGEGMSATLLIVYHSQSGSCASLAGAVYRGAREDANVQTVLRRAVDASIADLESASAMAQVAAENAGHLSGGAKAFLDRVFYPAIARDLLIPYALLISAVNDVSGAVRDASRMLSGIPMSAATEPMICKGEVTGLHLEQAADLGRALAAGIDMGIF